MLLLPSGLGAGAAGGGQAARGHPRSGDGKRDGAPALSSLGHFWGERRHGEATAALGERAASAGSRSDWGGRGEALGLLTPGNAGVPPSPAGTGAGSGGGGAVRTRRPCQGGQVCCAPREESALCFGTSRPAADERRRPRAPGETGMGETAQGRRAKSPSPGAFWGAPCPGEDHAAAPRGLATPKHPVLGEETAPTPSPLGLATLQARPVLPRGLATLPPPCLHPGWMKAAALLCLPSTPRGSGGTRGCPSRATGTQRRGWRGARSQVPPPRTRRVSVRPGHAPGMRRPRGSTPGGSPRRGPHFWAPDEGTHGAGSAGGVYVTCLVPGTPCAQLTRIT